MIRALISVVFVALAASCAAGPASHSPRAAALVPTTQRPPEAILAAAGPAAAAFRLEDRALLHIETGLRCPATFRDTQLVDLVANIPGHPNGRGVTCIYVGPNGLEGFLAFRNDLAAGVGIVEEECRGLPRTLGLDMGPPLPGIARFEGALPSALGPINVKGAPRPVSTCGWTREPFSLPIVISVVSALQVGGWTVQAAHLPPPPPCCAGYTKPMSPSFWIWEYRLLSSASQSETAGAVSDPPG